MKRSEDGLTAHADGAASPRRFAKNAASNLLNGASTAVLAIALPYVLVKNFDAAIFGLWVLLLQLGGYANYLNLGIQTAVGRYVSEALSLGRTERVGPIASAGTQFLMVLASIAVLALLVTSIFFHAIFPQVDPAFLPAARSSLWWIGSAFVLALPASALLGVFIGVQKNEVPAYLAVTTRLLTGIVTAVAAAKSHDLATTSAAFFAASAAGLVAQYCVYRFSFPSWPITLFKVDVSLSIDMAKYCTSLAVWSMSMLLVNGLSITLVGMLDFKNLAYFGVAVSLVTFLVGIQQSIFSPLIQIFAGHHARGDTEINIRLLLATSTLCSGLLVFVATLLFVFGQQILTVWVGADYSEAAFPILMILVAGNVIRYSATPYALWLIAAGHQKKVLLTPFLEGLVNLLVSIVAGYYFGATGIAFGVIAGGVVGIAANFCINIPSTLGPDFDRLDYALRSLGLPTAVVAVTATVVYLASSLDLPFMLSAGCTIAPSIAYLAVSAHRLMRSGAQASTVED